MKRNIPRTLLFVFVATLVVNMAARVAKGKDPQCTSAGVAGQYGYTYTGTVILPTGAAIPVAAVGRFTLDAAGNFVGSQTRSTGGGIGHETLTATVTTNPDCTGTGAFKVFNESGVLVRTATLDFVYVDSEREIRSIFTSLVLQPSGTSLGAVITVDSKKLFTETDNEQ